MWLITGEINISQLGKIVFALSSIIKFLFPLSKLCSWKQALSAAYSLLEQMYVHILFGNFCREDLVSSPHLFTY